MSLIELLLALVCVAQTAFVAKTLAQRVSRLNALEKQVERVLADRAERARFLQARDVISRGTGLAPGEVDDPVAVAQASHDAIAAIPFGILESIPVTAETTKAVRAVHDEIAGTVYDALSVATRGISQAFRKPPR